MQIPHLLSMTDDIHGNEVFTITCNILSQDHMSDK